MTEVDALDWYETVVSDETTTEEYVLEHSTGAELSVTLAPVDRKKLLNQISKLPDEMLSTLSEADDEDEAQEMAEEQDMLSNVNGDTIDAFESICVAGMNHPKLSSNEFQDIVNHLSFEVLFELGSKLIELSFEETGSVEGFRKLD